MLTIRLQRVGRKNQPMFRIVLAEKHRAAQKQVVESLGIYNPRNKDFSVKEERLKHWLDQHVELSPTVHNLLVTKKMLEGDKVKAWRPKPKEQEPAAAPSASAPAPAEGEENPKQAEAAASAAPEQPSEEAKAESAPAEDKLAETAEVKPEEKAG